MVQNTPASSSASPLVTSSALLVRRRRMWPALLVVAGLAGAACADDLSDAPATTAAPAATAAPATTEVAADTTSTVDTTPLPPAEFDIVGTALGGIVFSQLAGLVVEAGLVETLRGGPFTVFAPTDEAFDKVPVAVQRAIQDDPDILTAVLTYHVVPGELVLADLEPGTLETVSGMELTITRDGDTVYVNGNPIVAPDVQATNGVIHVMNDALVPPLGNIVEMAQTLPCCNTLVDLVVAADLVETLSGEGPFTVFAPVDAAFEALDEATLEQVGNDVELLTAVLTYHVLPGALNLDELEAGTYETVNGAEIEITKDDGVTLVNGVPVAVGNIQATNGVVHAIGEVLLPPS